MSNLLIIMVGPSGSGKSTAARHLATTTNAVIINRDDIRSMLFGLTPEDHSFYYLQSNLGRNEQLVTAIQNQGIRTALEQQRPVIVDNTNLKEKYINQFKKVAEEFNTVLSIIFADATLEECIERDLERDRVVGEEVIRRQYKDYLKIKEKYNEYSTT